IAGLQAGILERLPGKLLTTDQVRMLKKDNVVSAEAEAAGRTLAGMGINPSSMAAVLPTYLDRFRERGQYDAHRLA
ncbi:MAG: complex I NDUFA9 subunit family protein, partial [Pannonibacter sp.]